MEFSMINQPRVFPRQKFYQSVKRFLDLMICSLTLPATLPVMLACAVAIKLDDPDGPVFFIQDRIGKGERPFKIIKFRTMKQNLDDAQGRAFMKAYVRGELDDDSEGEKIYKPIKPNQVFRVGRFLRKTSLDELPQIINVLKGEMSIVGPRPNVVWEVDAYRPWHYERLEVLPGITGLAQVRGRSSLGFNDLVRHDIEYIEKKCLSLDIKILWWTFLTAVQAKGVR